MLIGLDGTAPPAVEGGFAGVIELDDDVFRAESRQGNAGDQQGSDEDSIQDFHERIGLAKFGQLISIRQMWQQMLGDC